MGAWASEMERIWNRKTTYTVVGIYMIVVILNMWLMLSEGSGTYRFGEGSITLTKLNASWFAMNGLTLIATLALLPVIFVDQISGDIHSGAYRLYVLCPKSRGQLWLAKLLALITTIVIINMLTYAITMAGAWIFFPSADTFHKYLDTSSYGTMESIQYTTYFYIVFTLTCISKLLLSSIICLLVSRPLIAYLVTFASSFGLYMLVTKKLVFLADPFQQILLAIGKQGNREFWYYLFGSIVIFSFLSFWGWKKKMI
ncbi:ABC transporter permease [Paenibacillus thiaminolyticus]|uniref:ABC transporter permease n=1 Tax=Paenibacillus thiaminolyticus TaxID=49283 RepID=A0AAP9DR76_PANTH|nr:hypothetical protein [Paenibacillus thiaminolyticus]MCY9537995.1 ABC transporter permease [Paenibacillus thiaminolyticus]MCY9604939.1 ABC transporter permease [Paenibacillus thiaminolyticus]MCY9610674.1 ABC transporter permease [Paenibacillus thiaminolyticus]MCY9616003.1 ABC transporter permease [Paenibacillus thiaminolyticus]MCY9622409.1 ABC transporter permease [Paenibacillus thiaminolyticus]